MIRNEMKSGRMTAMLGLSRFLWVSFHYTKLILLSLSLLLQTKSKNTHQQTISSSSSSGFEFETGSSIGGNEHGCRGRRIPCFSSGRQHHRQKAHREASKDIILSRSINTTNRAIRFPFLATNPKRTLLWMFIPVVVFCSDNS